MRIILLVIVSALVLDGCGGEKGPVVSTGNLEGYSVALIVVDTLRADHVGAYGYGRPTTPFIDRLAKDGLVFDNAYANSSYITQSLAALFSGRLPTSGGSIGMAEAEPSEKVKTLAQYFRAGSFQTGLVTNQGIIKKTGFTKGFTDVQVDGIPNTWDALEVTKRALTFVEDSAGKPFFLYAHYVEPHHPYAPPPGYGDRFGEAPVKEPLDIRYFQENYKKVMAEGGVITDPLFNDWLTRYDGEIAFVDHAIEQFVTGLKAQGRLDKTLIIVTSPHGAEFLDHGYVQQAWTLYNEVIRVPLVLSAPGLFTAQRLSAPVSLVDLLPTLAGLFGLALDEDELDGHSFLVASGGGIHVTASQAPEIAELVIRERCIVRAVIGEDWKYIAAQKWFKPEQRNSVSEAYLDIAAEFAEGTREATPLWAEPVREELFNLAEDPGEKQNILEDSIAKATQLRRVLAKYRRYCEKSALTPKSPQGKGPELDPEQRKQLKDLGYL